MGYRSETAFFRLLLLATSTEFCRGQDFTSSVPAHFYPVGPSVGDNTAPVNDDGSTGEVFISVPFPYFDQLHPSLYVNTNGGVSFLVDVGQYTPDPFPLDDSRRIIAPFWADVDTERNTGRVYWRETMDSALLSRLDSDVRSGFVDQNRFSAAWAFVVTWYKVTYFGGNTTTSLNTFQAILTTNGRHSFVIFNYGDINWTTGTASGGTVSGLGGYPAQAGFNAGDGKRYFSIPGSRTAAIVNVEHTSNVGLPGRWMFRVDEAEIVAGGCNTQGVLAVGPRFASVLGGKKVTAAGPCFNKADDRVVCRFDKMVVPGEILDETHASCVVPATFKLGRRSFSMSVDGGITFDYHGVFWFVEEDDEDHTIELVNPEAWKIRDLNQNLSIKWNPSVLDTPSVDVDFVTLSSQPDGTAKIRSVSLHPEFKNTGKFTLSDRLDYAQSLFYAQFGAIRVTERSTGTKKEKQSLWSPVGPSVWYVARFYHEVALRKPINATRNHGNRPTESSRKRRSVIDNAVDAWNILAEYFDTTVSNIKAAVSDVIDTVDTIVNQFDCEEWHAAEKADPPDFKGVPPSPCNLDQALRDPNFVTDDACNMGEGLCDFFHNGAYHCVRSAQPSAEGASQQACYDKDGHLLSYENGGGTYDKSHASGHEASGKSAIVSHFWDDVLPFMACCKFSDNCHKYGEVRPTNDCSGYEEPRPAWTSGDPHIVTLDGTAYTFNGVGEFVLMEVDDASLVIQARAERYIPPTAGAVDASVWRAIALQANGSDIVQVATSERLGIEVRVNGLTLDFEDLPFQPYNGVAVLMDNDSIVIRFDGGSEIQVSETMETLTFITILSQTMKGKTRGLLGFWNDNPEDDFLTPNGTTLSASASTQEIYYQFGSKWRISAVESLFTYPVGKSYADYQDTTFIPLFELSPTDPNYQNALDICGDSYQCQYDFVVTGDEYIAKSTRETRQHYQIILQDVQPVITCGFPEVPRNGSGNTTNGPVGVVVVFWCSEGFTLQGSLSRECMDDGRWSGEEAQCIFIIEEENEDENGGIDSHTPLMFIILLSVLVTIVVIGIIISIYAVVMKYCLKKWTV